MVTLVVIKWHQWVQIWPKKSHKQLLPFVKHVYPLVRLWGTLGFVREQCPGPVIANGAEMTFGAFRDTWPRSLLASCACWCCGLGGGRNGGAIFPCSAVSPMCHLTPFCTRCDAEEHENKNTLPQVYKCPGIVSEWVPLKNRTLFFLLPPWGFWFHFWGSALFLFDFSTTLTVKLS